MGDEASVGHTGVDDLEEETKTKDVEPLGPLAGVGIPTARAPNKDIAPEGLLQVAISQTVSHDPSLFCLARS